MKWAGVERELAGPETKVARAYAAPFIEAGDLRKKVARAYAAPFIEAAGPKGKVARAYAALFIEAGRRIKVK